MTAGDEKTHPLKTRPPGARQHVTAGPYSPVLEVDARRLVVISGQVAVDLAGNVVGSTVERQTEETLLNCQALLRSAGVSLADVFKVNAYFVDLNDWPKFNTVYEAMMPKPLPVRTAVQAVLLPGFLIEVEMWAVKGED
jgi:2-iminobutanoate/2-iminopropanoate deaminase